MHVAAVQYDIAWQDKAANHRTVEAMLDEAAVPAGALVLLPELGDTGFSFDLPAIVDDRSLEWARGQATARGVWIQVGYAEMDPGGKGRNCATLVSPAGEAVGTYRKVHPFSYGGEADHYAGGDVVLVRSCAGAAVAPLICYDLRFPELWRVAALAGAEVFTIGASWPDARQDHWRTLLQARAVENLAAVVAVNRVGSDPHLSYAGGSMIVSARGEILAEAGSEPAVIQARLDLGDLRAWRSEFPALRDAREDLLGVMRVDAPIRDEAGAAGTR